jgi:hypothetical protein
VSFAALFTSGRIADLILLTVALEFAIFAWRGRGPGLAAVALDLVFALAPGACLVAALRVALTGASWIGVAVWVTLALPFHIGDVWRRRLR